MASKSTRRPRTSVATIRPRSPIAAAIAVVFPPGDAQASSTRSPGWAATSDATTCDASSWTTKSPVSASGVRRGLPARTTNASAAKRPGSTSTPWSFSDAPSAAGAMRRRVGPDRQRRGPIVELEPGLGRREAVAMQPPGRQPPRMGKRDRQVVESDSRILIAGRTGRQRQLVTLTTDAPQERVDEGASALLAGLSGHVHRIADDCRRGNAIQM